MNLLNPYTPMLSSGDGGGGNSGILQAAVNSSAPLQVPLQFYQPQSMFTLPAQSIQLAQSPFQMNMGGGVSGGVAPLGASGGGGSNPVSENFSHHLIIQPEQTNQNHQQMQMQPQQLFMSGSGGVIQPGTIIPQHPLQPSILQQPQIITQASQPIQVMLVQYTPQQPLLQGQHPAAQSQTIPQIVQVVNPQTGQIQHVLQHVQPSIQMQQLSVGGGGGGQVLMPVGGQGQQQLVQTASGQLQFTSLPASQHQGMIITSQPNQVIGSQTITASGGQVLQLPQAVKQGFESAPSNKLSSNYQVIGRQTGAVSGGQILRVTQGDKRKCESVPPNKQSANYQVVGCQTGSTNGGQVLRVTQGVKRQLECSSPNTQPSNYQIIRRQTGTASGQVLRSTQGQGVKWQFATAPNKVPPLYQGIGLQTGAASGQAIRPTKGVKLEPISACINKQSPIYQAITTRVPPLHKAIGSEQTQRQHIEVFQHVMKQQTSIQQQIKLRDQPNHRLQTVVSDLKPAKEEDFEEVEDHPDPQENFDDSDPLDIKEEEFEELENYPVPPVNPAPDPLEIKEREFEEFDDHGYPQVNLIDDSDPLETKEKEFEKHENQPFTIVNLIDDSDEVEIKEEELEDHPVVNLAEGASSEEEVLGGSPDRVPTDSWRQNLRVLRSSRKLRSQVMKVIHVEEVKCFGLDDYLNGFQRLHGNQIYQDSSPDDISSTADQLNCSPAIGRMKLEKENIKGGGSEFTKGKQPLQNKVKRSDFQGNKSLRIRKKRCPYCEFTTFHKIDRHIRYTFCPSTP